MMENSGSLKADCPLSMEHVPLPTVVCDEDGVINWANALFLDEIRLNPIHGGVRLFDFVKLAKQEGVGEGLAEIAKREASDREVRINGKSYSMHIGMSNDLISCVFTPDPHAETDYDAGLPPSATGIPTEAKVSGNKMLKALVRLSRDLNLFMGTEELIQLFVKTYEDLFPNRLLCIRLLDHENHTLKQVHANGCLQKDIRESLNLTNRAVRELALGGDDLVSVDFFESVGVKFIEEYECVFVNGTSGFDIPLYDGSALYGLLNFEYTSECAPVDGDRLIAILLAQQMCTFFKNERLFAETIILKDYLEKLLDCANAPVVVVDKKRIIKVVNQAFEKHTEYDRKDILGEDLMSLISDSERAKMLPVVLAALRGESISNFETKIPRAKSNGCAHIAFNTGVVLSALGDFEGVIFVGQDLTEVRALQQQIIHSEKLATLGQVAAGVAHELNNPLTSISVYANYLEKKCTDMEEADRAKMRRIVDAAGRIQVFTRDLVTYARPSGEEPVLIHIPALIKRALSFCEHLIDESQARVELTVQDPILPVYGIRGQLEQVFVNLLTNACHALPDSGGSITIYVGDFDDERLKIAVKDTGRGIAEEQLANVFEPFYTTKPEGQGTGLGLSIVRNILVNHHAVIEVESELGKGTTFSVIMYTG